MLKCIFFFNLETAAADDKQFLFHNFSNCSSLMGLLAK